MQHNPAVMARIRRVSFILILVFFLLVVIVEVVIIVVVVEIVVIVVLFLGKLERRNAVHVQIRAAFLARQGVALIQVLFIDINPGVAFWTFDHLFRILPPGPADSPVR
jgi:fatty acid desaturase